MPKWRQSTKKQVRVVLRGDIVKDDSGSYAVKTEQGSSASQMTAAKVLDIISRLPGCAGQAGDAVSAKTQVRIGRCSKNIEYSYIGMSRHLDSFTTTQMAKGDRRLVLVHRTRRDRVSVAFLVQGPCEPDDSDCLLNMKRAWDRRQGESTVAVASEPARPGSPLLARSGCWSHGYVYRVCSDSIHRQVIVAFSHL